MTVVIPHKVYFKQVIITSLILSLLLGIFFFLFKDFYFNLFPFLILFFIVSTLSVHYLLSSGANLKPQRFISHFMMITGGKFFLYLLVLALAAFNMPKSEILSFALTFFIYYVTFSVVEVRSVLHVLKSSKTTK